MVSNNCPFWTVSPRRARMATTRPEASETTGTLRETSGATVAVTTNSEVVGCAVASTSGNCSGWSTVNRLRSTSGTTVAGGGAAAAASTALLQPPRASNMGMESNTGTSTQPRLFISDSILATTKFDDFMQLHSAHPPVLLDAMRLTSAAKAKSRRLPQR